jgi:hypothetical protein
MRKRIVAGLLLASVGFGSVPAVPAYASVRGRQNTAMALTGLALYTWLNAGNSAGRRNTALLATAAAGAAWYSYSQAKAKQRRYERRRLAYYRARANGRWHSRYARYAHRR